MAKSSNVLDWCLVRLGEDHNWWVDEVSDPIRWDVDGLGIIDPRQMAHLIELVEPLRDYGFDQELMEVAFVPFRIEREADRNRVRLKRVKDSLFDSEEKLFALPDVMDDENGPYADLMDHLTKCRVKMLNGLLHFKTKLTVDEVEDELREVQNANFIEGKAVHPFEELCQILDYVPDGYDLEDADGEIPENNGEDETEEHDLEDEDLPDVDDEDEARLSKDESLKWDEDEEPDSDDFLGGERGSGDDEDSDDGDEEEALPKKKKSSKPTPKKKQSVKSAPKKKEVSKKKPIKPAAKKKEKAKPVVKKKPVAKPVPKKKKK